MMLSRTLVALSCAVGTLAHGGVLWYEYEGKQVIGSVSRTMLAYCEL